ncbi:MAG: NTP transferase domain-containing protein, partial [Holophagaceae bacterium]|nr:NTP transferase domain-containing protein [Holophagaceae bacterium]
MSCESRAGGFACCPCGGWRPVSSCSSPCRWRPSRTMTEPLDGFLLAAGLGLRMGALSQCLPKPAWTLRGRPLLQWGADQLRQAGARRLAC